MFEKAVELGIVTWHAGPMNMMFETMMDTSLVDFGLQLSEDLDKRFGIVRTNRVLSQRDVPGQLTLRAGVSLNIHSFIHSFS